MIHVVQEGESIDTIAQRYKVSPYDIAFDNQILYPFSLVVGQALWIMTTSEQQKQEKKLQSQQRIELDKQQMQQLQPKTNAFFGYAYPFIDEDVLLATLPYMDELYVFSYGYTAKGTVISPDDEALLSAAKDYFVVPILTLTPFSVDGTFSNLLVNTLVENKAVQEKLVDELLMIMQEKGYQGMNIDFEYILKEDKEAYVAFVTYVKERMAPFNYVVSVALPPKTSDDQPGLLYEGMDYEGLGNAADYVFLMTYEWGYTYGPPMAIAPIPNVRKVLDYAVSRIAPAKIYMGLPNYAYDWPLPYERGVTKAKTIGYVDAIATALLYDASVQYDKQAQAPYISYTDEAGVAHEIWFEDVRSMKAKFELIEEYGFAGGGYWNLMRYFRALFLLQNATFSNEE